MVKPNQNKLAEMLCYKRPAGSMAEKNFKNKYLTPLGVSYDTHGNGYIEIGSSPIIWSSHTDTVHKHAGRQNVSLLSDAANECFATSNSNCLGADCTTGVFIMTNMIRNRVPGLYVFHHGEEKGCVGSRALVKERWAELKSYKACIAFDRKGYTDIVRYQHGSRCCSDVFVNSLAGILGRGYKASSGVFTDSGEYVGVVGECTNISVGYFSQHTMHETQDIDFALWLADRMCRIDVTKLVFKRVAGEKESEYPTYYPNYANHSYPKPQTMFQTVYNNTSAISNMLLEMGFAYEEVLKYCESFSKKTYNLPATTDNKWSSRVYPLGNEVDADGVEEENGLLRASEWMP